MNLDRILRLSLSDAFIRGVQGAVEIADIPIDEVVDFLEAFNVQVPQSPIGGLSIYDVWRLVVSRLFPATTGWHVYFDFSPLVWSSLFPAISPTLPIDISLGEGLLENKLHDALNTFFDRIGFSVQSQGLPAQVVKSVASKLLDVGVDFLADKLPDFTRQSFFQYLLTLAARRVTGDSTSITLTSTKTLRPVTEVPSKVSGYSATGIKSISFIDYVTFYRGAQEITWGGIHDFFTKYIQFIEFNLTVHQESNISLAAPSSIIGQVDVYRTQLDIDPLPPLAAAMSITVVRSHYAPYNITNHLCIPSSVMEEEFGHEMRLRTVSLNVQSLWKDSYSIISIRDRELLNAVSSAIRTLGVVT